MYYKHYKYTITEKSSTPITGTDVVTCDEDFNLSLYDVVIGAISPDKRILRHTKIIRNTDNLVKLVESNVETTEQQLANINLLLDVVFLELLPQLFEMIASISSEGGEV